MDPWGTPHEKGVDDEDKFPKYTEKFPILKVRYKPL